MADVARGHGGDGGNSPPHGLSHRLLAGCEASQTKRRGRGKGKNIVLYKKFEKNKNQPLKLNVFCQQGHCTFVGENQSHFKRLISSHIWMNVPFYYRSWDEVPDTFKADLWPVLYHYFDIKELEEEDDWPYFQLAIDRQSKKAYSDRKSFLKRHFDELKEEGDAERAKLYPPKDFDRERWIEVIDKLFKDDGYLKQCEVNKENRKKIRYTSYHGSESYSQKRWVETTKNITPSYIEGFKKTHTKGGKWVNKLAQTDHERLEEERRKMIEQASSDDSYEEHEIFKRALGERRGHIKGVGSVVRKPISVVSNNYPSSSSQQDWKEKIKADLQAQQQQQMEQLTQEHKREMTEFFKKMTDDYEKKLKEARKEWRRELYSYDSNDESDA